MKFSEFKYERPDLDLFKKEVEAVLEQIGTDKDYDTELNAIHKY